MKKYIVLFLTFCVSAASAFAETLTNSANWSLNHNGTLNLSLISIGPQSSTTDFSTTVSLGQFDASLGELDSVQINFNVTNSDYTVTSHGLNVTLIDLVSITQDLSYSLEGYTAPGASETSSGATLLNLLIGGTGGPIDGVTYQDEHLFDNNFEQFIGNGDITITVSASDVFNMTQLLSLGLGSAGFSGSGQISGTFDITYNYTAAVVPEPATYACIFGAFALGCAMLARKRK